MAISLVAYIPDELVVGCVEDIMNGHCHLNNTEASTKMTTIDGYCINDKLAQFLAKLKQFILAEGTEI